MGLESGSLYIFSDERSPVGTSGFIEACCHPRDVFTFVLSLLCTSYATTNSANFVSTHQGSQEVEVRVTRGTVLLGADRLHGNVASNSH